MQKKILVADDAMFIRQMIKGILITNKYTVFEAGNGQEAIEQYIAHEPDLVFMDITMPVMDGISATKAIKENDTKALVVMCTAMGQKQMVLDAVSAGAKDFIVKPFRPEKVLECVRKHLG